MNKDSEAKPNGWNERITLARRRFLQALAALVGAPSMVGVAGAQEKKPLASDKELIEAINAIRRGRAYQGAEALRRNTNGGAAAMAKAKSGSKERQALLTLIATWESIAWIARNLEKKDDFFQSMPICHMWEVLKDGIETLKQPSLSRRFRALYEEYLKWLKDQKKDDKYRSQDCTDAKAFFG